MSSDDEDDMNEGINQIKFNMAGMMGGMGGVKKLQATMAEEFKMVETEND